MYDVILFEPEIPPNTGNIIRLCANTGSRLHLVHPLGFDLDHAKLRRAGLDYHEFAEVAEYKDLDTFIGQVKPGRLFAFSTRCATRYDQVSYRPGDALLFGPETRGLPQKIIDRLPQSQCLRVPMREGQRSLNLSNTVALVVYEAWRQLGFEGGA